MVKETSMPFKYKLDWWVSNPPSRNTLNSSLFQYFCQVQLIIKLLSNNKDIAEIIVDSSALKIVLRQLPGISDTKISVREAGLFYTLKNFILFFRFISNQCFDKLFRQIVFIIFFKGKPISQTQPITLIGTYSMPGYYAKDRYYNGLWDLLNDKEKKNIFFVPTIVTTSMKKIYSVYIELINSERQFLF